MITLPRLRDQNWVTAAVEAREGFAARLVLLMDGEDVSPRAEHEEGKWGQTEIPISLDCTMSGFLPRRFEDAKTELFVEIEGVMVPQMVGRITRPIPGGDATGTTGGSAPSPNERVVSDLQSASAGALLPRTTLDRYTEYPGATPEQVARDALGRVAVYDRGRVRIEPLGFPLLDFVGENGFAANETSMDVLSRLQEREQQGQAFYLFRDTAWGGHEATVMRGLATTSAPSRVYHSQDIPDWIPPQRTVERYSAVVFYKENPLATPETNPEDRYSVFERAEVEYFRPIRPAFANTVLYVPFEDSTAEAPAKARLGANGRADVLSKGSYGGEMTLPSFDPLIERGDTFEVIDPFRDDDGLWDRLWLHQIISYEHLYDSMSLFSTVGYTAALLEEDLVKVPTLIVPGISAGVGRAPYGQEGDDLYFEDSLSWVSQVGDDVILSDSAGLVQRVGDDIVVTS